MTRIACPIMVDAPGDVAAALSRAARATERGAELVEWRVDLLVQHGEGIEAVTRLAADSPLPCIITCRHEREGGQFDGDEAVRAAMIDALAEQATAPRYLDLELASFRTSAALREAVDRMRRAQTPEHRTSLVLSAHDFDRRPADLLQRVAAMTAESACDVIKLAWTARSLRDNLEAFDLLRERTKPMIALCMGRFGLPSRVLAPKFGALLTFATDEPGLESAPGQPTIDDLRQRYRFDTITAETRLYGIVGWPVEHSRSPDLHNAGFAAVGHDGVYLPLPVPPEYEHFKATVGSFIDHPRLAFRGASVTIPHKEHLVRFIEDRGGRSDDLVARIGAANTLTVGSSGAISCSNTDAPAAIEALTDVMGTALSDKHIAVLGAGGAARAIVAALQDHHARTTIINRTRERAEALAHDLTQGAGNLHVASPEILSRERFDVYINCTPLGMTGGPSPDASPLPDDAPLDDHTIVFDTVYTPARTPLVKQAEARGATVVFGESMFLKQAALQFKQWTGRDAPLDSWRAIISSQ